MNQSDIAWVVAEKTGLSKTMSEAVVHTVFECVKEALAEGQKIQIAKFGSFRAATKAARTENDPKTNTPVHVPASKYPVFKPGKTLKEAVNRGNGDI